MLRPKKTFRGERPARPSFLLRLFAWALLTVFLIPLSLILALYIPAVQRVLLQEAVRKLESSVDIGIQLESFRWSPFRELRLVNLKVKFSGQDILECEEAKLGYRLSWTWPYVHPKELFLEKPWLQLERAPDGQWRLSTGKAHGTEASRGSKPFPWSSFPWPQVRIVSGNILGYQDGHTVLSIRDVNATLHIEEVIGSDGPRLKIDFGQWKGCVEVPELGEWRFTGEAEIKGGTLSVTQMELTIPKVAQLSGQGTWDFVSPYDGALEIQIVELSTAVFPALRQKLPQLKEITGSLRLSRQAPTWSLYHDLHSSLGNLQGLLQLESGSPDGRIIQLFSRFSDLELPVLSQPSESHLFGKVELTVSGTELQTAQATLHTLLEPSRWGNQTIHGGELTGSYKRGMLEINTSKIQSSLGDFDFSAYADLGGLWDPGHQGEAKIDLRAEQGSLEKIFAGTAQRFGGSIFFDGHYGPGDFRKWERWQSKLEANLSLPQLLTLKASGKQKNDSLTLDYGLDVSDLQSFAAFYPSWHGKGKVTSRGNIKGKWPDLVWEGSISSPLLQFGPVQAEQASLKGKGKIIGKESQRELTLRVKDLSTHGKKLGSLNLDLQQEADICRFNISDEGAFNYGSARLSGRVEKIWGPVRTLSVSESTLAWKNQSASLDGKIEAAADGIRVRSLNMQHAKETVQLAGEVWFNARTDLKLTFDGINLAQWSQVFGLENPVSGLASGQAYVKGRTDQPEASFNLQLTQATIIPLKKPDEGSGASRRNEAVSSVPLIDRLQLQGAFAKEVLTIQGDVQSPSVSNPVHLSARIPMRLSLKPPQLEIRRTEESAFSVKVTGFQAESLLPYLTFLEKLGGRIVLEAQGGGTINQPLITATGSWQNGSLTLKKWTYPVENIMLDWRADSKQIIIQKGSMELLGGQLELKGRAGFPHFQEMDFEASATGLEVKDLYGITGKVSGTAQLTGTETGGKLTGDLHLAKAEMDLSQFETGLAKNIQVIDGEKKGEVIEVRKEATDQNNFYNRLDIDLTINLPPSGTWVRGMGLEAEITGALSIVKRPFAALKLRGGFQTLRGEYKFQDYKLKIVDGELIFPESPQPEPQIKIVCQKDVKDAMIQVQVTGPLKQPKLVLSSIPSMNQVDMMSYLLFDRPAGDLSSRESFQLQDKAASWMGSQTSILLKRVLGETPLTPDTIEYRKSTVTSKGTGSAINRTEVGVVAIGKYVIPDLYVTFEKGVTGEEGNLVDVEYRINRYLSIQSQFGGTGQSGIDVFLRHDFGK